MDFEEYFDKAYEELRSKSLDEIQTETAMTWGARACAASELGLERDAHEYAHEAVEHAALTGDDDLLRMIREQLADFGVEY